MDGRGEYIPVADLAMIDARSGDAVGDPPLIGLYSRADWSHPGPLLFYLLAPFYWLSGGSAIGIHLGALAVNGVSVIGMALVARRRGGLPLMLVTMVACALLIRTLGAGFIHDPWNTYLPALPFGLLLFLIWSLACGERWALPLAALVASFLAQAHVGFVALALPLLAWGTAWLAVRTLRGAGQAEASPEPDTSAPQVEVEASAPEPGRLRRWTNASAPLRRPVLVAAVLGLALWLPPAIDVASNTPSNARRLLEWFHDADEGTAGPVAALRVISGQFTLTPEWLVDKQAPAFGGESPHLGGAFPLPVLLLPVAVAGTYLFKRGSADRRHLVALLAVSLALSGISVARTVGPAFDYRLRWSWLPPMLAFVVVAWATWLWVVDRWPGGERKLVPGGLVLLAGLTGINMATSAGAGHPFQPDSEVIAALEAPVTEMLDHHVQAEGQVVLVIEPYHSGAWYSRGLVVQLERRGFDVRVEPTLCLHFGEHRVYDGEPVGATLLVVADDGVAAVEGLDGLEPLATWASPHADLLEDEDVKLERLVLREQYEAGELDRRTYEARVDELQPPELDTVYRRVAVFLDERPDPDKNISVGHDLDLARAPC